MNEAINLTDPQFIGLSAMSFQYPSAVGIGRYIKENHPKIPTGLGGYHITGVRFAGENNGEHTLLEQTLSECDGTFDYLFAGETEHTFNQFLNILERKESKSLSKVSGLSFKSGGKWVHNPRHDAISSEQGLDSINLPDRQSRIWVGYHFYGESFDTISTSRGCNHNCKICSIKLMYPNGRHSAWNIERIIQDIKNAKSNGVEAMFYTDDNPAMHPEKFKLLQKEIIKQGLYMTYSGTVSTLSMQDKGLVKTMWDAGWRFAFLGVENTDKVNLKNIRKASNEYLAAKAIENLQGAGMTVLAGIVVGNPEDTEETIRGNFRWFRKHPVDSVLPQFLTPYPGTITRKELFEEGLIKNPGGVNENEYGGWSTYNGEFAHCSTRSGLTPEQIESIVLEEKRKIGFDRLGRLIGGKVNFPKNYPKHFRYRLKTELLPLIARGVKERKLSPLEKARKERERKIAMNQFNI